ncbi:MAG: hypothetical protein Q4F05_16305 [bacterium]|nr:hypothetical protein [bacterium]
MLVQNKYSDNKDNPIFKELLSILGNGFVLSLFTINFLCFEYVLPILGSFIMLYGCHLIKDHSIHFKRTYQVATARSIVMLLNFLLDWTEYHNNIILTYMQIATSVVLILLLFFNLNRAFKDVYHCAGITPYNNRLAQYTILYLCSVISTYLTIHLGILGAMLSLFILILNIVFLMLTFYQIGNTLSKVDIDVTLSHYSFAETRKIISYLGIYGALLCLTVFFSNKAIFLPFSSSNKFNVEQSSLADTESHLLDYGISKEIAADLPSSEIEYLVKATSLTTKKSVQHANKGSLEITLYDIDCTDYHRVIVYYNWLTPPSNRLYQIIECKSINSLNAENITSKGYVTISEDNANLETPNINLGLNKSSYPYTEHKLFNEGDNLRGYLAFSYRPEKSDKNSNTVNKYVVNCYYQVSVFNLPYLDIVDYMDNYKNHTNNFVFDRLSFTYILD